MVHPIPLQIRQPRPQEGEALPGGHCFEGARPGLGLGCPGAPSTVAKDRPALELSLCPPAPSLLFFPI